jgi:NAD(P)-dependent dehydrogenase (short-subunit alcohol dehydrogenase family)
MTLTRRLEDEVAIITGSGRGIGRAIALGYAGEGARVLISARTAEEVQRVAEEIREQGGEVRTMMADVALVEDVQRLVEAAKETWGRVDVLVNNAGVSGPTGSIEDIALEGFDQTLAINARGPFMCCQAAIPIMLAQGGGNIINVSSGAGQRKPRARVRSIAYQVSKFALEGLTNALAVQLREQGINVNALQPGRIATRINRASPTEWLPGPPMGDPQDVVPAAIFLAGLQPGAMTGFSLEAQRFNRGFRPELTDHTQ